MLLGVVMWGYQEYYCGNVAGCCFVHDFIIEACHHYEWLSDEEHAAGEVIIGNE